MKRFALLFTLALAACSDTNKANATDTAPATAQDGKPPHAPAWAREPENAAAPKPGAPPAAALALVGEYGTEAAPIYVPEKAGNLWLIVGRGEPCKLDGDPAKTLKFSGTGSCAGKSVEFAKDGSGIPTSVSIAGTAYPRRQVGPAAGTAQLAVTPLRPVPELIAEALTEKQPAETGSFKPSDLIEVVRLSSTVKLDVRYATTNNFLGSVFYSQPRAFLQLPAAQALVRAQKVLQPLGYGLLIHDGYRPWYVTKVFWDATPSNLKWLVANPASGSRHNRGAAVDLTLYELATGKVIEMPSTYDESTPRAYAFYPGGTDLQRWHRAVLRRAMEAEGFTVNPEEWWHFDYKEWRSYRIGNVRFEEIR